MIKISPMAPLGP
jgi:hypothetical protein